MWLELLAEHGVLGFLLVVVLIISCLFSLWQLNRELDRNRTPTRLRDLAPMLTVAFVGFMTGGTFLDVAYHELFYQLVAMVIIAGAVCRQSNQRAIDHDNQVKLDRKTEPKMHAAMKEVVG
jgi:O-antigen ligase